MGFSSKIIQSVGAAPARRQHRLCCVWTAAAAAAAAAAGALPATGKTGTHRCQDGETLLDGLRRHDSADDMCAANSKKALKFQQGSTSQHALLRQSIRDRR